MLLALLLAPRMSLAVETVPGGKSVTGAERDRWFEEVRERQKGMTGLSAEVVQRKRSPLLKNEAVSRGKLSFRKPASLRWEVVSPDRMIVVMDGGKVTTYYPKKKEAERRDMQDDFASRAALGFFESGMTGSLRELERRFLVDLFRSDDEVVLRLIPRSKMLSRVLASIRIHQDPVEGRPRRIVVEGARGDRTETTFSRVVVNPEFPPDTFALRLGPEVRVTETGGPERNRIDAP
ncbi:MAG: outer membrane lipoprotein carrier protein LolA [bacterium]|jgi:outer membrane lipoprotein-sorting protein